MVSTTACLDVFAAPELRNCFPRLKNDDLRNKSWNEFLIRGKVEAQAISGCVSVGYLRNCYLDDIAEKAE